MSAIERSIRRLRRRAVLASWLGRSLAWIAPATLVAAGALLVARAALGWPVERAAWILAPLALLPLAAIPPSRRRAPGDETCAAWLDLRSASRGLVLTASERPDSLWRARAEAALADEPALPRFALRRPAGFALAALAFAAAALWIPVSASAAPPGGAFSKRLVAELAERLDVLAAQTALDPELLEALEERVVALRELADDFGAGESLLEAADLLRERMEGAVGPAALGLQSAEGALGELARRALEDPEGVGALLERAAQSFAAGGDEPDLEALRATLTSALGESSAQALERAALRELGAGLARRLAAQAERAKEAAGERIAALRQDLRSRLAALRASGVLPPKLASPAGSERAGECERCGGGACEGLAAGGRCAGGAGDSLAAGQPGRGGLGRGRADAPLTWGEESPGAAERFREHALPELGVPDLEHSLPGAVTARPPEVESRGEATTGVAAGAGPAQVAWQRRLAPSQREAVARFFRPAPRSER